MTPITGDFHFSFTQSSNYGKKSSSESDPPSRQQRRRFGDGRQIHLFGHNNPNAKIHAKRLLSLEPDDFGGDLTAYIYKSLSY